MRRSTAANVYPTLAKPAMAWGVPRDYAIICLFAGVVCWFGGNIFFANKGIFIAAVVLPLVWGVGLILSKFDPEFSTVIYYKRLKLKQPERTKEFKGNRYFP